jgi:hypothetical protein
VPDSQPDFQTLLTALNAHRVRCVLIGGWAMRCHGSQYFTADMDLGYARDPDNLAALADALAPLHPRLRGVPEDLPFRWDARTLKAGLNFMLVTDAAYVDLLGHIPGVTSFDALWHHSTEMNLFGLPVRVASLEDLIAMKRATGRAKDQAHIQELERLRKLTEE